MYGGNVSASSQTYNHPDAAGTALSGQVVAFQAMAFSVSISDNYALSNASNTFGGGSFLALYQTSFNPSNPLNNLMAVSDGGGSLAHMTQALVPGTHYFLVTSGSAAGTTGDLIDQISDAGAGAYTFFTHSLPAVDTPAASNITGAGATLGGTVEGDGGTAVTERGIVYSLNSTNADPTIGGSGVTKVVSGSGTGLFSANVTGLTLGATYAYRAYATNAVGTFYTSPTQTFVANAPPVIGGMITKPQGISDAATVQPFNQATVTDPDSPPQTETATITYTAANGAFTTLGGFTGSAGSYTMTGTAAAIQTALRGLTFVPTAHQVPAGQTVTTVFTIGVSDGIASVSDSETSVVATATAPQAVTVGGIQVNDGNIQRSEVDSLTVTFSGPVTFAGGNANAAAAFQLKHLTDGNNVILSAVVSTNGSGQTVVTLTFSGAETDPISSMNGRSPSLADGRYSLTVLSADVTGSGGLSLNNGSNYVSPTDTYLGNGLHLYRLFGDANGDGVVDATDVGQLKSTYNRNSSDPLYLWYLDADGGGAVDAAAVSQFKLRFNVNVF
jgi:hypothetical protein